MISKLRRLLKQFIETGDGGAAIALYRLLVNSVRDARFVCDQLRDVQPWTPLSDSDWRHVTSPFQMLVMKFHNPANEKTALAFAALGIPLLLELFDARRECAKEADAGDLLEVLETFVRYGSREGADRLLAALREGFYPDHDGWKGVFDATAEDEPFARYLCRELRESLPKGRAAIRLLELANEMSEHGKLAEHPFDNGEGLVRLESWLTAEVETSDDALHAAKSLRFLNPQRRDQLVALALSNPASGVQMLAARAAAGAGSEAAVEMLSRFCLNRLCNWAASNYLEELGRTDAIPAAGRTPLFAAEVDLATWLAHPIEFGREPDEMQLFDTRELFWPPTNDRRQLWLFRYCYHDYEFKGDARRGIGMFGSQTQAIYHLVTRDMSPEDVYAIHCCDEMRDSRTANTDESSWVPIGREILREHNLGF